MFVPMTGISVMEIAVVMGPAIRQSARFQAHLTQQADRPTGE